jgi:hypothetical protein
MRRLLLALCLLLPPVPGLADADALNLALAALAEGDTELAAEAAAELDDPVARDIVEWTRLRRGGAEFGDYVDFLERNPGLAGPALSQGAGRTLPAARRRCGPRRGLFRRTGAAHRHGRTGAGQCAHGPRRNAGRARRGDGGLDRD